MFEYVNFKHFGLWQIEEVLKEQPRGRSVAFNTYTNFVFEYEKSSISIISDKNNGTF